MVLCLGDSLTEGTVGVGFIPFLREFLSGHEYVNLGVNGDTIAGLRRRAERLAPRLRGDVAVVWIGTNDVLTYQTGSTTARLRKRTTGCCCARSPRECELCSRCRRSSPGPGSPRCTSIRWGAQPR